MEAKVQHGGSEAAELDGLTPKMAAFAREYAACRTGRRAALAAGYTKASADSTAARLLKKPAVQAYLKRVEAEAASKVHVDAELVLRGLVEVAGDPDHRDRVKALVALGKVRGVDLFEDRVKVDGGTAVNIVVGSFAGIVTGKPGGEKP